MGIAIYIGKSYKYKILGKNNEKNQIKVSMI